MGNKIKIAIIGLGSRGRTAYGVELLSLQDRAEVTAVADPNEERLKLAGDAHGVPEERRFRSAEELLAQPKLADVALICTLDQQHGPHAVAAMRKGYDLLLEKPISPDIAELQEIVRTAREENRRVVVCHVLRYTDFFGKIKQTIDSGRLGKIINIQALENVRYWHQAHSFVRGNWRRSEETSPMILAKCCHDLDYLIWLCGSRCERVSSFGSLSYFKPENAPFNMDEFMQKLDELVIASEPIERTQKSWNVVDNLLTVEMTGESLEKLNELAREIESNPIVDTCTITTANKGTKDTAKRGVWARLIIYLCQPPEEVAES